MYIISYIQDVDTVAKYTYNIYIQYRNTDIYNIYIQYLNPVLKYRYIIYIQYLHTVFTYSTVESTRVSTRTRVQTAPPFRQAPQPYHWVHAGRN